jgi:16S rRNA (cytosine967-C5)-methyltransferase
MERKVDETGLAPRKVALRLLGGIVGEGKLLSELIGDGALDQLANEDRARAQRLALMTLRSLSKADAILKPFLKKAPPLAVRNALRLGVVEICEGAAAHGVVNSIVAIVGRGKRTASYRGLSNAVLRKVAETGPALWPNLPAQKLPGWLRGPLTDAWGRTSVTSMELAFSGTPPTDLTPREDAKTLSLQTGGQLLPTGSVRLRNAGQISKLPGYAEGKFWVQDAAAALPARILAARQGERVLDLCAAPGGKTLQLAATGAEVTAVDISEERLQRLNENLERTGLTARVITSDALEFKEGGFDAILLDAPCSATGTIRRHPDLPFAKDGAEFLSLFALQSRLIDHALTLLRPGGRLVYCTCSLLPDEGEVQVEEALARHPGLMADAEALDIPGVDPSWRSAEGGLRLRPDYWPELGGMDGFHIACLRKPA